MSFKSGYPSLLLALLVSGCASLHQDDNRRIAESDLDKLEAPAFDLSINLRECYSPDLGLSVKKNLRVNGHLLTPTEAKNVQWIEHCVLPYLPGNLAERADVAAKTTWWSLREGILDRAGSNAFRYANCHENGKDHLRSDEPLHNCPTNLWQVGLAAGQVMNYPMEKISEKIARLEPKIDPHLDEDVLLRWTATLGGFTEGTPEYRGIVKSADRVRRAWLIRNPLVGFQLVSEEEVQAECLTDHHRWCTAGDYPSAVRFSHSRRGVLRAISDLKRIYLHHLAE